MKVSKKSWIHTLPSGTSKISMLKKIRTEITIENEEKIKRKIKKGEKIKEVKGTKKRNLETEEYSVDELLNEASSIDEAERAFLESDFWAEASEPPIREKNSKNELERRIHFVSSGIMARTKKAAGSAIIHHPDHSGILNQLKRRKYMKWFTRYPTENCPAEFGLLILYKGFEECDQPVYWIEGRGYVVNYASCDPKHYGKWIGSHLL